MVEEKKQNNSLVLSVTLTWVIQKRRRITNLSVLNTDVGLKIVSFICRIGFEIPRRAALLLKINDTYESVFYPNKIILML